ncbi:MAG TPA: hypothetical protein VN902_23760 [Candidatus Acidoferrales bacterium]|jgi:Holliday junction resolvase-like predicted endonuclease|nr:hypothetical protein [Candidatus Acidoferrales bacterium]
MARNFTSPGIQGEMDRVGCDGSTLAFVEVSAGVPPAPSPLPLIITARTAAQQP